MAGQKDVRRAAAAPGSLKIREWVFGAPSIGMCTSCLKEFHATLDCLGNVFAAQADLQQATHRIVVLFTLFIRQALYKGKLRAVLDRTKLRESRGDTE